MVMGGKMKCRNWTQNKKEISGKTEGDRQRQRHVGLAE
jgi:hypothetical protein